ncbi:MAG: tetratricopeptide repeat protein [Verrucomicrobia bacterium]|nr:tetratricopeptide repeat protein [Verrucomicrobiota bacterium]
MAENATQTEAAELHERSVELWLGGRREEAIAMYREALGLESDAISLQLRDTLPNSYSDPNATPDGPINLQQQNAFAAYRNTARLTTDDARAWFNIGLTHEKEGRAAEAGQAYVESFKSHHRTHAAKELQAKSKSAVGICRRVTEIDPKDAKAWINLGAALGQVEQPDEEIDAYRKAIQLAPKYADAWYNLGVAQARREEDVEAIHAYKQALLLSPKFAKAWFNLGVLQGKLGNPHEKIRSYRKAVEADHNFGEGWHNLGVMLNAVGQTEEGNRAFTRARKLLNPKFRIAESIEFKSATTPGGAPDRPAATPPA